MRYYSATKERNTLANPVSAPYIRKSFHVDSLSDNYELVISVVGIYELSINGVVINKGYMLPYRTNPNHIVYYDNYSLNKYLKEGENVIGVILGNGFSNSIYEGWDFDKLSWAHAPKIALEVKKNKEVIFDMSSFKTHDSEVIFDDFHAGEHIDANKIIKGWNQPGFKDDDWNNMIEVDSPKGELRKHPSFYPTCYEEVKPLKVIRNKNGYVYDFGSSFTGMYKIRIKGQKNKVIKLFMNDILMEDGTSYTGNICCIGDIPFDYRQFDWFILSGGEDCFYNRFSHKSGRFMELINLSDDEAKNIEIVAYKVSSLPVPKNYFRCDNEIINKLQQCVINSDISNFFYFPTDCPHREKNGWTGDATVSVEQMLINFGCDKQFKEWFKSIIKAQTKQGKIPGIIPTDTWGYAWGNGPGWDTILFELPYRTYVYTGDKEILKMAQKPIIRYLKYMRKQQNKKGLFLYGLGDWLPVRTHTPRELVDTIMCKYNCDLAYEIFNILGDKENARKAKDFSDEIKANFNKHYVVNYDVREYTQAWGAMADYFNMYDGEEKTKNIKAMMRTIRYTNDYMDFGVFGNRTMWRVLANLDQMDLAIKMMTQDGRFSLKKWLDQGATTLFEDFIDMDATLDCVPMDTFIERASFNHHFWGDISSFFYRHIAGLQIDEPNHLKFAPRFAKDINHVEAKIGKICVVINKEDNNYNVKLDVPKGVVASIDLPSYCRCSIQSLKEGRNSFTISINK